MILLQELADEKLGTYVFRIRTLLYVCFLSSTSAPDHFSSGKDKSLGVPSAQSVNFG